MRVHNKSKRMYQHGSYQLPAGKNIEVPTDIAKLWLATGDVIEYVDPKEAKAKEEKAAAEKAKLEEENTKLKEELQKLKAEAKAKEEKAKKTDK